MEHTVIFQPSGRRGKVEEGKTLLQASHELGVDIEAVCGAAKVCGKCKVKIEEGYFEKFAIDSRMSNLSPLTEEEKDFLTQEEINNSYRLACAAEIKGDVLVFVPEESRGAQQVVLETGKERVFNLNPAVKKYYVELSPATLEDHRGDFERLREALHEKYELPQNLRIDYFVLTKLPIILREGDWKVTATVWNDQEIIMVEPGLAEGNYGVAIDIGTTTVAAYLMDLNSGQQLSKKSMMNPQVRYGEDVLSRITYSMMNEGGLQRMHEAIIDGINTLIAKMAEDVNISMEQVQEVVLVFNTAMHHIALNIEPKFMGRSPFAPAVKESLDIKARDLGIKINPCGNIHVLPIEAGFVGADNMGVMIAEEPYKQDKEIRMIIDIGTNGEIDLGNSKKMLCTSCATGPALEGAQIKFGMRAAPGAIEKVRIDPETLEPRYKVIGKEEWYPDIKKTDAKGLCGSGIIDVIAEMFTAGIINKSGRFNKNLNTPRIRRGEDGKYEYVLAWAEETSIGKDIVVTQADVRAVQLAKAALYVGGKYLMEKLGVDKVDSVTLAGAFGSYIDTKRAMILGMFPDCPLDKVVAVGNAAGDGAQIALLDKDKRVEANKVAREVEFVETAIEEDFQQRFAEAMPIPHGKDEFPHLQEILKEVEERTKKKAG
ncbi:ASKHA domain-containing protein [Calderihabitans maritimus]|uniref:Ferredoxin n=1 Tax=Calderihabitans maritimus TaxID=1246530 RepID=A0A1Z5HP31_9FIRM|nr:ASKHA domain-containing protein [Calderihabitans maritimus]GAW91055.1 ferredoxin [Calderihabitans maritimus]